MTSRNTLPTNEERKQAFNRNLRNAIELGQMPNSGDPLNPNVIDAIRKVAKAYPKTDAKLVKAARQEFAEYVAWLAAD